MEIQRRRGQGCPQAARHPVVPKMRTGRRKRLCWSRAFWVLATGTVLRMSVHGAVFVHFVPIIVWKGEDLQTAANLVGLMALCSVPVILLFGWLSDRFSRQKMLAVSYTSSAVSLYLLTIVDGNLADLRRDAVLRGFRGRRFIELGAGRRPCLGANALRRFAGCLAPLYNTALLITPVAAGFVFDQTGSYHVPLLVGSVVMLLAAFTFLQLKIGGAIRSVDRRVAVLVHCS